MAASRSSPSPPPTQSLSAGGGANIPLFLDSDLGTHLVLCVAADSTIRGIKAQVAAEHAATFPDIGPVVVKSFQVPRKGAMYHLCDSMAVMSPFSKVEGQYFLHVNMAAAETDATHQCRDEVRGTSSGVLPPLLKGREDDGAWVTVRAHDVHLSSSSQQNTEGKSTTVCPATDVRTISVPSIDRSTSYKQGEKHGDQNEGGYVNSTSVTLVGKEVGTKEEDLLHSVEDHELCFVSPDKQMVIREEKLGELHAVDDLSEGKDCKKARMTGSFDTSAVEPIRETNDYKTRDVENVDKFPVETSTNSHGVHSSTSCQQGVDGNVKEDSNKLENPITTRKKKIRKKIQSVTSKDVCAQEMTEPSTEAVEVPKATGEDLHHENQGLQGHGASNVEMTSRDKTNVIPTDMLLPSSQQNSGSQVTKHVQLGTDAQATSDLAADQSNIDLVHEGCRNPIVGDVSISTCKVVAGEEKSPEGTIDLYHDESAVDASNMEEGSKREDVLETIDNSSQEKSCKQSKKVSSVGLNSMDAAEAKDQCGYGKKAGESDIISTQREIVNNPYKRQITSSAQQGDFYAIENPNGDVKQQKKKRRREPESSKDDPTQGAAKSSGLIANAVSTQNTDSHCLLANQITLGNIGEETADAKDQCRRKKAAELVIVSTQVSVHDPSNVKQGDSDVMKNPNGDGKRKKKKVRHLESSKDDPLRCSEKISDLTDVLTENTAVPADGRTKSTKRQRSKVSLKNAPTNSAKSIQSLGEQVRHVPAEELKGENCNKAELFQGCAAVDAPASTVQILQKKSKRSSKTRTPKIEEVNHSITDTGGNHNKESTVGAPDKTSALKGRKKSSKTELRSQCTNLEHGSDHFGTGNVGMPSVSAQNMNRGDGNVKKGKKKRKQKSDMVKPESLKTNGGNQDTDNCPQDLMQSDVRNGRVEQGNAKENNDKAIQNDNLMQQETQDATRDSTLEMKPHQSMSGAGSQTNLPIVKDYTRMSKKQRNSTSQTKCHAKSRNHDGSIDERTSTNPNAVSNLVQSISMNPQASDESACGTPAVDQFRVAVRNVPRKKYKKAKDKSKKDMRKRETGKILGDTISKSSEEVLITMGEKAAIGNSSSTFADSAEEHLPGSLANTVESVGDGQRAAMLTSPPNNEVSRVSTPNWESQPEVMLEREQRSKSNADRPSRRLALEEEVMVQRAFTDENHASPTPGSGI